MSGFYRNCIRPALFALDSEEAHDRTLRLLGWISRRQVLCDALASFYGAPKLPITVCGLNFANPVGVAAGMDKGATAVPVWESLGFGFVELGGVTWRPQPGNPAPRMFRAAADEALVNRMGFNNPGAEAIAAELARWRSAGRWPNHPVGINLGKSKDTPLERAAEDYAKSLRALLPHADFFVVNVSSPNTPNLRALQDKAALDEILAAVQEVNRHSSVNRGPGSVVPRPFSAPAATDAALSAAVPHSALRTPQFGKPIFVKVAPDLSFEALDEILELTDSREIAGIVATNTTVARPEASDDGLKRVYAEAGGLSGRPLRKRSTEVVRHLYRNTRGALPIIGVGGIFSADDAWEKIAAGAALVQLYTGLVYEGAGLTKAIVTGLQRRLEERGLASLRDAVGTANEAG